MRIFKCDKCGAEVGRESDLRVYLYGVRTFDSIRFDLCEKCAGEWVLKIAELAAGFLGKAGK